MHALSELSIRSARKIYRRSRHDYPRVDDLFAMCSIRAARDAAWTHAEVLWALRSTPSLRQSFFSSLDAFTGFAGRGLLASSLLPVIKV